MANIDPGAELGRVLTRRNLPDGIQTAPGTILLEDLGQADVIHGADGKVVLQPQPSSDPNDPLNWTMTRKVINFAIVASYSLWVFSILDIGTVGWAIINVEYGITYDALIDAYAANLAGLSVGGLIFIPFALKFGRRPVYLVSSFVLTCCAMWTALGTTVPNIITSQVISGLAGSISETIVTITIGDLFFTHQRGRASAVSGVFILIGSFLAPVAAGYIVESQTWRWPYWYCTIFLGITFLLFVFLYEETKYNPPTFLLGCHLVPNFTASQEIETTEVLARGESRGVMKVQTASSACIQSRIDHSIPLKPYRQRLALVTNTPGSATSFYKHMYQPLLLLMHFPAVVFVALQYGALLSWLSMIITSQATFFTLEPYNFQPSGIGLLSIPPLIGSLFGAIWCGPISDWSIVYFAKRNQGVYEPEMRLYIMIVPAVLGPIGVLLYGISTARGMAWIIPCIATGIYGFGVGCIGGLSTIFLLDSYRDIIGDGLVAVTFIRNILSTVITFTLTPWIEGMGLQNTFILTGALCLGINLLMIPMVMFGKKWRIKCAARYLELSKNQYSTRPM